MDLTQYCDYNTGRDFNGDIELIPLVGGAGCAAGGGGQGAPTSVLAGRALTFLQRGVDTDADFDIDLTDITSPRRRSSWDFNDRDGEDDDVVPPCWDRDSRDAGVGDWDSGSCDDPATTPRHRADLEMQPEVQHAAPALGVNTGVPPASAVGIAAAGPPCLQDHDSDGGADLDLAGTPQASTLYVRESVLHADRHGAIACAGQIGTVQVSTCTGNLKVAAWASLISAIVVGCVQMASFCH